MTRSDFDGVRDAAHRALRSVGLDIHSLRSADIPIEALLSSLGYQCIGLPRFDPLLAGALGVLDREAGAVWIREGLAPSDRRLLIAHELGHAWCGTGADINDDDEGTFGFLARSSFDVDGPLGYSPVQADEIDATVFGLELIAPGPALRAAFLGGMTSSAIAEKIGVRQATIDGQLVHHILRPIRPAVRPAEPHRPLDTYQRRASVHMDGDVTVLAGPGTGKTRALIGHAVHLIRSGVRPDRISILTFARHACSEIRNRLEESLGDECRGIRVSTTHALGLEILRTYGGRIGLSPNPGILSADEAIRFMEQRLDLFEMSDAPIGLSPLTTLIGYYRSIGRWKSKGITPASLLSALTPLGVKDDAPIRAYSAYQALLSSNDCLDLSDLVYRSLELLRSHQDVLSTVAGTLDHVLVDEAQDLHDAEWEMIRLLTVGTASLWTVGDPNQAIYGFRGAGWKGWASGGMGRTVHGQYELAVNYRCGERIVRLLRAFADHAGLTPPRRMRSVSSGERCRIRFATTLDERTQADAIAEDIRESRRSGTPYSEHAILVRTNKQAGLYARVLRDRGIPVIWAASVLSSDSARTAIAMIARAASSAVDARGGEQVGPREVLSEYLFGSERAAVRKSLEPLDYAALAWLYRFVDRWEWHSRDPDRAGRTDALFAALSALRRAVALREDGLELSHLMASDDAVRVLTVHRAKGLEFHSVYVPSLNIGRFPIQSTSATQNDNDANRLDGTESDKEEARLLYVAISRARESVTVSGCRELDGKPAELSSLGQWAQSAVKEVGGELIEWRSEGTSRPARSSVQNLPVDSAELSLDDLDVYHHCPRRFYYERTELASGAWSDPDRLFQRGMRTAMRTIQAARVHESENVHDKAYQVWLSVWNADPWPKDFDDHYPRLAQRTIRTVCGCPELRTGEVGMHLRVRSPAGVFVLTADRIVHSSDGSTTVEIFRYTRRPRWNGRLGAIVQIGAEQQWPDRHVRTAIRYCLDGEHTLEQYRPSVSAVTMADKHYNGIMNRIKEGDYPAKPSRWCAQCPFLFDCPEASDR